MHKPLTTNNVTQFINLHHDEFSEEQKALIMARFGIRAKLSRGDKIMQSIIYKWFRESSGQIKSNAHVLRQVADIVRVNKSISKYDLIKECEQVLSCKGDFRKAINKACQDLVRLNIIKKTSIVL